jgi:uncharacterized membrane protein YfcA
MLGVGGEKPWGTRKGLIVKRANERLPEARHGGHLELKMVFPVSGVETQLWLPPLVGMVISFFTSMGGVSGAFLILPFQVSVLGFTSPAVSPTNLVFNIVGIPSAVYRYFREGRMNWPLAWNIIVGTLPGLVAGMYIRILYLPDPRAFKIFAGCVLTYIGIRLILQVLKERGRSTAATEAEAKMRRSASKAGASGEESSGSSVRTVSWSLSKTEYEFFGERFSFHTTGLFSLALVVGLVGGVYGIGGGAIIAPFIVAFFGLPIHTIAGATLMGTCVTSVGGALLYQFLGPRIGTAQAVTPDWLLGFLFGIGGFVGMYFGASAQKYMPAYVIKPALAALITILGLRYVVGYFV